MNFEMLLERAKAGDKEAREGDLLVVTELKRFGRNYGEIYKEWFRITKEIGADIKVTSMPILDTTQSKELVGQLITDVVLAVFAYVADRGQTRQVGLTERHELQRQGIEVARGTGGTTVTKPLDEITFLDIYNSVECVENGELFHFHENPSTNCPVGRNIHYILDDKLYRVQSVLEKELASITLADIKQDTEKYLSEENR